MNKQSVRICVLLLGVTILLTACSGRFPFPFGKETTTSATSIAVGETSTSAAAESSSVTTTAANTGVTVPSGSLLNPDDIPAFSGKPYIEINGNLPDFTKSDLTTKSYEYYSPLDRLGRCGECVACVGVDLMPTEKRGSISSIKPTGWRKYTFDFVNGGSLYNRCHLIAHQLAGEDANKQNLITGTRFLNEDAMLPFEEMVGNYVRASKKHVLYRVTPVFKGNELVARGVQMEGYSVEDKGKSICYNVYCYNVQPGVEIDYATGEAKLAGDNRTTAVSATDSTAKPTGEITTVAASDATYIINIKTGKFHKPDCDSIATISEKNKKAVDLSRDELIKEGYQPCGACQP